VTVETAPQSDASRPEPTITLDEIMPVTSGPGDHFDAYDTYREKGPIHFGAAGPEKYPFWMVTGLEDIRACFSSSAVVPDAPNPPYKWIPEMLDPPIHTKWRQLLGPFFAPGAVERYKPRVHEVINEILDEIAGNGKCDYVAEVALRFPNTIFMEIMGLPVGDAAQFQTWETAILHAGPSNQDHALNAMMEVMGYFGGLVAERRKSPREDILSTAIGWSINGEKVSDDDLMAFCLLMFMAGLDTVAMQLSYSMWYLARHQTDRQRILDDPTLWTPALEEFLRYYAFVSPGRKVMADTEIAGCPVMAGEMLFLPIASANRDPAEFPDADKVIIDRKDNRHLAFGAGPHRCLGSHLARQELLIGLQAWHERIPNYRLDPDITITEHGGQVGLDNLPLIWDV
jgi:cytochrome P450